MFDLKATMERDKGRCVTADGRKVRILCIDKYGRNGIAGLPLVCLMEDSSGDENVVLRDYGGAPTSRAPYITREAGQLVTLSETIVRYAELSVKTLSFKHPYASLGLARAQCEDVSLIYKITTTDGVTTFELSPEPAV